MEEKKVKKKKNLIIIFIQLILIAIIVYSLYKIVNYNYDRYKAGKLYDEYKGDMEDSFEDPNLMSEGVYGLDNGDDRKAKKAKYNALTKRGLDKLRKKNSDIVAFLNIPDLDIGYPVVYKDNNYYLRKNLKKEYSLAGTLFVEELNNPDFLDMNTIIYGHNMSNALVKSAKMFEPLIKLGEKDYASSKPYHYIEVYTDQGVKVYRVFSSHYTKSTADYRTISIDGESRVGYLKSLEKKSRVRFADVEFDDDSKILTLSTCDNVTNEGRFAVHAVLIDEDDDI